jgi:hypothetical protein
VKRLLQLLFVIFLFGASFSLSYATVTDIIDFDLDDTPITIDFDSENNAYILNINDQGGEGPTTSTITKVLPFGEIADEGVVTDLGVTISAEIEDIVISSDDIIYGLTSGSSSLYSISTLGTATELDSNIGDFYGAPNGEGIRMVIDSNDNIYSLANDDVIQIVPGAESVTTSVFGPSAASGSPDRADEYSVITIDSNDNIYVLTVPAGGEEGGGSGTITKITPSQQASILATVSEDPIDLVANSQGEVYVLYSDMIEKYDASGTIIQNRGDNFYEASANTILSRISIDSEDSIYFPVNFSFGSNTSIFKIDDEGLVGTGAVFSGPAGVGGDIVIDSDSRTYVVSSLPRNVWRTLFISLTEETPIGTTEITRPSYEFNSTDVGDITYGGSCSSETTRSNIGLNTISFNTLEPGTYSDCTIQVDDGFDTSNVLRVSEFTIEEATVINSVQESSVRLSVSEVSRRFARARAQEAMTSSGGDQSEISQTQCPSGQRITQNLRLGDQGQQVQLLQGHINRILEEYYDQAAGPVDGIFGPLTQQGVERLQEALAQEQGADLGTAGIDGIVGPLTREAINNSC